MTYITTNRHVDVLGNKQISSPFCCVNYYSKSGIANILCLWLQTKCVKWHLYATECYMLWYILSNKILCPVYMCQTLDTIFSDDGKHCVVYIEILPRIVLFTCSCFCSFPFAAGYVIICFSISISITLSYFIAQMDEISEWHDDVLHVSYLTSVFQLNPCHNTNLENVFMPRMV